MIARKRKNIAFLFVLTVMALCACGQKSRQEQGRTYHVYYENNDETGIFSQPYVTETVERKKCWRSFWIS